MPTSYLSPKLKGCEVAHKGGRGVFAVEPVPRGTLLVIWGGEVITKRQLARLPEEKMRLIIQVEENHYLLTTREGPADWINHSCAPNAGLRGQISLIAMQDIAPGDEVCYDYAMSDASFYDEFECRCGAENCRRQVTRHDWRQPELWERYNGYFSPYLQRRIDRLQARHLRSEPMHVGQV